MLKITTQCSLLTNQIHVCLYCPVFCMYDYKLISYTHFFLTLMELIFLSDAELAYLSNFRGEHHCVGSIAWEDKVDVWQANIVVITCLSVIVYSENEVDS